MNRKYIPIQVMSVIAIPVFFEIYQIYKVGICDEKKIQISDNKIAIYQ